MKYAYEKAVMSAAAILVSISASQAQASYLCTGVASAPASPSTWPYFDNNLTDPICDTDEIEAELGITIDTALIVGSKSESDGENPITSWAQDEFGLGTLTVTDTSDTSGDWTLTGGGITPLFYVDKYDSGYDVYTYMGPSMDPFGDSWDGSNRGTIGAKCTTDGGSINCNATTSHISVYGVVPIPAAVWLFGSGLIGLAGIARRRKAA